MRQHNRSRAVLAGVAFCVAAVLTWAQEKPSDPSTEANARIQADAKQTYERVCAACHGLDARGSERGPDIASRQEVVLKTDAELAQILANGKPAGGMPSFSSLGVAKLSAMVAYLRTLQGRGKGLALPGDPERGRVLFFGKAKCSQCHSVAGQGGFFAPDLATFDGKLVGNELRSKILSPDQELDPGAALFTLCSWMEPSSLVQCETRITFQYSCRQRTELFTF